MGQFINRRCIPDSKSRLWSTWLIQRVCAIHTICSWNRSPQSILRNPRTFTQFLVDLWCLIFVSIRIRAFYIISFIYPLKEMKHIPFEAQIITW